MESNDSVMISSTTDTAEQVSHAMGKKIEPKVEAKVSKPAESEEPTETREASGASEEGEEQEGQPARPGKDGFQKRVDKLVKERADERREKEYWRELALKGQKPPEQAKALEPKKEAATSEGKPNKDDFRTHEEYLEALTDWKADQKIDKKLAERDAKQKEQSLRSELEKTKKAHLDRVESFRKTHEDFNDVLEEISDFRLSQSLERALLESDNGPELMYEFAKNPKELERINALEPGAQGRALGRFESSFQKSAPQEKEAAAAEEASAKLKPKISKAPTPIKPVGSKAGNPKTIFDDDISDSDWIALRNKQLGV